VAAHRRLARVHFHGLADRASLVGELLQRERELSGIDALGLLAEQPLAQDVELVPQGGDLTLRGGQLLVQRRDEGARGGEIVDGLMERARLIHSWRLTTPARPVLTSGHHGPGSYAARLIPAAAARVREVDAREQEQRSPLRIVTGVARRPRPATQTSRARAACRAPRSRTVIPRENLETIAAPIAKEEEMTRQGIQVEALPHQGGQPVDGAPQIRRPGRHVDAHRGRERQHADRSALTAARTRSADAPAWTARRSPPLRTISITGPARSAVTRTGTNVGAAPTRRRVPPTACAANTRTSTPESGAAARSWPQTHLTSWNQLDGWLRQIDGLRAAA
jgi:hypothetical protein